MVHFKSKLEQKRYEEISVSRWWMRTPTLISGQTDMGEEQEGMCSINEKLAA